MCCHPGLGSLAGTSLLIGMSALRNRKVICNSHSTFMPPRPRPAGGIERSDCPYVRTSVRTYVRPSVDKVKIFVLGRIKRPITSSKSFHMRMYLYERSRNIQEP